MTRSASEVGSAQRPPATVVHVDATQGRKMRMRRESLTNPAVRNSAVPVSPQSPPVHFDATESRRSQNRAHPREQSALTWHDAPRREPLKEPPDSPQVNSTPSISTHTAAATPVENTTLRTQVAIESFLIDFVVEQTGYPAEIIELDWDIEADLGIDSIKKAQLFGELREFFDLQSHANLKLDDYRSLRDIANLLHSTPGKGEWLTAPSNEIVGAIDRVEQTGHDSESSATEGGHDVESRATEGGDNTERPGTGVGQDTEIRETDV